MAAITWKVANTAYNKEMIQSNSEGEKHLSEKLKILNKSAGKKLKKSLEPQRLQRQMF